MKPCLVIRAAARTALLGWCCAIAAVGVAADDPPATDPYDAIVQRNPFGLKPPTPPAADLAAAPADKPLPPIALTGLAALADRRWACFNLAPKGSPARSLRLAIGQREGDLQLLSVNVLQERVEILYHGQPLQLTLRGTTASRQIAAELKDQFEMQAHTRASELYQRRECLREQQELVTEGFAAKP